MNDDLVNFWRAEVEAAKEYINKYEKQILSLQSFIESIRLRHAPDQGIKTLYEDASKVYCKTCKDYRDEREEWPCFQAQEIIDKVTFIHIWEQEDSNESQQETTTS